MTLARAKTRIRRANCRVGRIRRRVNPRRVGRVIAQTPRPGTVKPSGFRVNLVLGRR
jgi:beta-lactam-binding protein with PASTA domain